jgi:hypothetical protein
MYGFDPTLSAERIQAALDKIRPSAWPELIAYLEHEIRLRGAIPRRAAAPNSHQRHNVHEL